MSLPLPSQTPACLPAGLPPLPLPSYPAVYILDMGISALRPQRDAFPAWRAINVREQARARARLAELRHYLRAHHLRCASWALPAMKPASPMPMQLQSMAPEMADGIRRLIEEARATRLRIARLRIDRMALHLLITLFSRTCNERVPLRGPGQLLPFRATGNHCFVLCAEMLNLRMLDFSDEEILGFFSMPATHGRAEAFLAHYEAANCEAKRRAGTGDERDGLQVMCTERAFNLAQLDRALPDLPPLHAMTEMLERQPQPVHWEVSQQELRLSEFLWIWDKALAAAKPMGYAEASWPCAVPAGLLRAIRSASVEDGARGWGASQIHILGKMRTQFAREGTLWIKYLNEGDPTGHLSSLDIRETGSSFFDINYGFLKLPAEPMAYLALHFQIAFISFFLGIAHDGFITWPRQAAHHVGWRPAPAATLRRRTPHQTRME